ncbi:hypothetical protein Sp245p_25150 (plasmid) [Azospirillum baldaniorum]|uniref:Nucleotidyl transferase domain-containing protein n=1 Tax=Azospirillum baldaniorum TaxID=1064539 RepID=A0A9P1JYJ7_9PROT|nr:NDP-sugar synthase [Azospirillum baldaniorum]AWJ93119.1 hypothetical protein Sp245p_25150 [Azospirillum baldaniorum]TWA76111.1 NDP-sugar pyrophosphorylase family protein [Azospirillum brasilense]CCD02276.1 protein of unknown function [Azospirillum baldaniorum]
MKAIIYWDRRGHSLAPLTDRLPPCLMPVAGRPLIERTLDLLVDAGVRQVALVSWTDHDCLIDALGTGSRWGLTLDHLWLHQESGAVDDWLDDADEALVLRGDALISPVIGAFLTIAAPVPGSLVHGTLQGRPALALARRRADGQWRFPEEPFGGRGRPTPMGRSVGLEWGAVSLVETLADYHAVNLSVVRGEFPGLVPFGRAIGLNLVAGAGSRVASSVNAAGQAHMGANSMLHRGVTLAGTVSVGERVIIDRDTRVTDSVILPDTYIGPSLSVDNAIIWGQTIIRIDTQAVLRVIDGFILADLGLHA